MHIDSIRSYCLSFPDATEKLQWGDNLCFKVRGKIFAILGLDQQQLCFKCLHEVFAELLERQFFSPAPYLGRYKWILVQQLDALDDAELEDLIRQSYEMVGAKTVRTQHRRVLSKASSASLARGIKKKSAGRKQVSKQPRKRSRP